MRGVPAGVIFLLLGSTAGALCRAADSSGLYAAGAFGYSNIDLQGQRNTDSFTASGGFRAGAAGGSVSVGLRPESLFGAELSLIAFGHANNSDAVLARPPSETLYGIAAEGLVYLPVSSVDFFGKAGMAELLGTVHSPQQNSGTTGFNDIHVAQTSFATGAGVSYRLRQWQPGTWAMRAQVEFFIASRTTTLGTLGLTYSF